MDPALAEAAKDPVAASAAAKEIRARAKDHKDKAKLEQARMRREYERLDEFRALCSEFGITLVIEDGANNHTEPKGRQSERESSHAERHS